MSKENIIDILYLSARYYIKYAFRSKIELNALHDRMKELADFDQEEISDELKSWFVIYNALEHK